MVLDDIDQKQALDDVFWMALFNLSISQGGGNDTERLYGILLPFMTGKNLEESMVDAHDAHDASGSHAKGTKEGTKGGMKGGSSKIGKKVEDGGATDGTTKSLYIIFSVWREICTLRNETLHTLRPDTVTP